MRSALLTYGTNLAVAVLSLVNVLITARALGPSGRGSVAFLTTVALLTSQIATLGLPQANANFAASNPALSRSLGGTSVVLSAAFGVLAAGVVALLFITVPGADGGSDTAMQVLVLAALPMLIGQICFQQLLQAQYGFVLTNIAWLLTPVTNVVVNATLALAGVLTVGAAVSAWIAGQALTTLVLIWGVVRRLGGFGRPSAGLARRMLGFGVQAHAGRVMLLGNYRLDQWLLGGIAGPQQLGLYSVAVAWAEALFFLPTALTIVQRPDLVRASRSEAERQASLVFRAVVLCTLVLAVALFALAPFLCVTLFGEEFRDSVWMLRVLTAGAFGIVALKLLGNALTAQRKPLLETAAIGAAFVSIVVLDVVLIPAHGGMGAAVASSIAYSLGGVAVAVIFLRALRGAPRSLLPTGSEVGWLLRRLRGRLKQPGS